MSSKSRKVKKPLELPLGKAIATKDVDLSHVRLPIDTSVFGLKHVLTLFETATSEVKSYLAYECDLMYECRVCRTIFRSIANFILHKRKFCRDKYNTPRDPGECCPENDGVAVIQRDIDNANQIIAETEPPGTKKSPGSYLNPIIENLLKRQEQKKFVEQLKKEDIVIVPKHEELKKVGDLKSISLEKIDGSDVAMFQTVEFGPTSENTELMKSEVMEIHSIFDRDEAVIGSNGKILTMNSKEKDDRQILKLDYTCTECNTKFSTKKTLTYHIKYKHSETKLVYPCPLCKDNLSNAWSVYRHLLKVHRMTSNQIRKYRNQINNSAICKKTEDNKDTKKIIKESRHGNDEENEWLDNIEGDSDLQMCGGCGKHFERKAALISHSVMCTKRIAVCNSIKESYNKKKETDIREYEEPPKTTSTRKVTGSAKRKSSSLITYKTRSRSSPNNIQNEELVVECESEEKDVDMGSLPLISEENDSDTENCTEWIKRDIQMYDKDRVMSIIGVVDTVAPIDTVSTSIDEHVSDRSDSPCRGFESSEYMEPLIKEDDSSNLTKPSDQETLNSSETVVCDDSKQDDHLSLEFEAVTGNSEDKEVVEEDSNNSEEMTTEQIPNNTEAVAVEEVLNNSEDRGLTEKVSTDLEDKVAAEEFSKNSEHKTAEDIKDIANNLLDSRAVQSNLKEKRTITGDIQYDAESNNSELTEVDVSVSPSNIPSKSSLESEGENSSEISLDNKINSDFQLDLCNDPNFQDVSIKSLIKEIIDEDDSETKSSLDENKVESFVIKAGCYGQNEEETTNKDVDTTEQCTKEAKRLNNNYDVETRKDLVFNLESKRSKHIKKRKRINSPPQRMVKRNSILSPSEDSLDLIENEVFISKISRFADMANLRCALCESQFNLMSELLPHMSNHLSWYRFQCSRCSFMSFNRSDCENHVQEEHKLPSTHIQGTVLPIPTWKSSLISDNLLQEISSKNRQHETQLDTEIADEINMSVDMKVKSVKLETPEGYCSKNENTILSYIDLTIEENPEDETAEATEDCLLKTDSGVIQDLSKQAIMEVILGNKNQNETQSNKCQLSEQARPLRNRIKSVKASQKDFIYDFDNHKGTFIKGRSSKVDTGHVPQFEVQE